MLAYLVILLVTVLNIEAQTTIFNELKPLGTAASKHTEGNYGNIRSKNQEINSGYKKHAEQNLVNLNMGYETPKNIRESSIKPKNGQAPINIHVKSKVPLIPLNLPLIVKRAGMPAPNSNRNKPHKNNNPLVRKTNPEYKANPQDISPPTDIPISKSDDYKNSSQEIQNNSSKFRYEDDTFEDHTITSSTSKQANDLSYLSPLNPINMELTNEPSTSATDDLTTYVNSSETQHGFGDDIMNIDNGTHCICIKKMQQHDKNIRSKIKEISQEILDKYPNKHDLGESLVSADKKKEDTPSESETSDDTLSVQIKDSGIPPRKDSGDVVCKKPVIVSELKDVLPVLSITNRKYEEIEERRGTLYPELKLNENISPWISSTTNVDPTNAINNCYQNYQLAYQKYLQNIAANNPYYKNGNYYVGANIPNTYTTNMGAYTSPYEISIPQNYGKKEEDEYIAKNLVLSPSGRVWRTWKDTEIMINRPNVYVRNPIYNRNYKQQNSFDISKILAPYRNQIIGLNGYYNKLNKPITYPRSYQTFQQS